MAISCVLNSGMSSVASGFATDIARRISQARGMGQGIVPAPPDEDSSNDKLKQLKELETALAKTVTYMGTNHGDQAASAMIGIIYKRLGNGEINETTLGNALLDVVRFVDANFGFAKGDAFMDHLNGTLNDSMNVFFDNGLNEMFFAVSKITGESAGINGMQSLLEELTEQMKEDIMTMLENARSKSGDENNVHASYDGLPDQSNLQGIMRDILV